MLRTRVAPHSEVIRVIVLEGSPCSEVPHRAIESWDVTSWNLTIVGSAPAEKTQSPS